MATLVLGALGTLIGGPFGGAIGALAGRQLDSAIVGNGSREGPRLKDLALTTSSYGTPIAKHYGRMRCAGTIIWATDLKESRETTSGGKGKPKTTSYSYTTSFAVAIASRPIESIGRIWADGNLLRGSAGDLKAGGSIRIYPGYGDQNPDPLLASALGVECPAFRHCAYVVFEDLDLSDFGNRIPALTFEVIADTKPLDLRDIVEPLVPEARSQVALTELAGISYEGGSLLGTLDTINFLYPTVSDAGGSHFTLSESQSSSLAPIMLPAAASAWADGDFGGAEGRSRQRSAERNNRPNAIRYYDTARDYQIGVQRPEGRAIADGNIIVEFPGALPADFARKLVNNAAARGKWAPDRMRWRMAELNNALTSGSIVEIPETPGIWLVTGWEWREKAVELDLQRILPNNPHSHAGDAGAISSAADLVPSPTILAAFELPWDGETPSGESRTYAAVAGTGPGWRGAALYSEQAGALEPIGPSGREQAAIGQLISNLPASQALWLERSASLQIQTWHDAVQFDPASELAFAQGENSLLVGNEILQFKDAEQLTPTEWRLSGLLRGRAGTESEAQHGHSAGATVVLLNGNLVKLAQRFVNTNTPWRVAAIGLGDAEPVYATVANSGATQRPLSPVHPRTALLPNGNLQLCWTRRARGAWTWLDNVETPLNEEAELYRIGIGDADNPAIHWETAIPQFELSQSAINGFAGNHIWVRQIGRAAQSNPLLLGIIP